MITKTRMTPGTILIINIIIVCQKCYYSNIIKVLKLVIGIKCNVSPYYPDSINNKFMTRVWVYDNKNKSSE